MLKSRQGLPPSGSRVRVMLSFGHVSALSRSLCLRGFPVHCVFLCSKLVSG